MSSCKQFSSHLRIFEHIQLTCSCYPLKCKEIGCEEYHMLKTFFRWKKEAYHITSRFQARLQELRSEASALRRENRELRKQLAFHHQLLPSASQKWVLIFSLGRWSFKVIQLELSCRGVQYWFISLFWTINRFSLWKYYGGSSINLSSLVE